MRIFILILMLLAFTPAVTMATEKAMSSMPMLDKDTPPAAKKAEPAGEVYICPMHPHIHGKKGDKCPICGMDLAPANGTEPSSQPAEGKKKILYWYDPMVPGQKFDKPGKSPYMDMDLIPFYEEEKGSGNSIQIDSSYRQALGVRTAPAQMRELGRSIHAFGFIEPSTRSEYVIAVRKNGWITDLKASAVGDVVKKGDLLFTLYSPDLIVAQIDYLAARKGRSVIGDADQRLRLYGMDEKAISLLNEKGKMLGETPFHAPVDGTVMALNVRKGSFVDVEDDGETIMTLQDLSQVWVNAHVPVRDLQFLNVGTQATVTVTGTGETYKASVDFIYPDTDPENRKGMARLILDNPEGKLKTNTPVNVMFAANVEPRLAVPEEAVLYDRRGAHVIMEADEGRFKPVMVKTGITADGLTEITSGLSEGQNVVTSGQFMIDAESNLRGGMENMAGMDMESGHEH
jgi:Cu(I)/Ag(I) efflux system membrane fusion protein